MEPDTEEKKKSAKVQDDPVSETISINVNNKKNPPKEEAK